jgi:hypothetical protein
MNKNQSGRGGRRLGAGRKAGSWDKRVNSQLYKVTMLEALGETRADASRVAADNANASHPVQALLRAHRDWRDRDFISGRRVMTLEQGEKYVQEMMANVPPPKICNCKSVGIPHSHCSICGVAVMASSGPMLLNNTSLGPICSSPSCYSKALRKALPKLEKKRKKEKR